jgi:protein-S-isoprenylcysteine O-methyltransferase Ste14
MPVRGTPRKGTAACLLFLVTGGGRRGASRRRGDCPRRRRDGLRAAGFRSVAGLGSNGLRNRPCSGAKSGQRIRAGIVRDDLEKKVVMTDMAMITIWVWNALELGLILRDVARRKGGTRHDLGTRRANIVAIVSAVLAANAVGALARNEPVWRIGPGHVPEALVALWAGLALRIWAVVTLGRSFRTTVEVDSGQAVVQRGPYRWVRHPSYGGLLLILIGVGLLIDNWLSLAIALLLPLATLLRRIAVEEKILTQVLGSAYRDYQAHTRRLLPGVW